jgi:ABC-type uncharacterized transport system ATPase subunit
MTIGKAPGGGIVLSRLCKSYGQVRAVRSVDLVIAPGETVALLGPNDAGKPNLGHWHFFWPLHHLDAS